MKVETPQILWNAEGGDSNTSCVNAALYSVSMVQSGIVDPTAFASAAASALDTTNNNQRGGGGGGGGYGNVLATAGNSPLINLWKVSFPPTPSSLSSSVLAAQSCKDGNSNNNNSAMMYQRHERGSNNNNGNNNNNNKTPPKASDNSNNNNSNNNNNTKIDYLCTLARHEGAVNCLAFSPDGLHLATGGDKSVIVWSVPIGKRGNGNGRHFWSSVTRESDLCIRIVSCGCEGVVDLSWSADSKRFLVGTIDSAVLVCEDSNYAANHSTNNINTSNSPLQQQQQQQQLDSAWKVVYRSKEHTHFVQGVSYDPLGVYLASMSNDRSVRIYPRKTPPKSKKKILRPCSSSSSSSNGANNSSGAKNSNNNNVPSALPPADHARMVHNLLTESKLEVTKSKQIKQRKILVDATTGTIVKQNLFADESTLESFFRRLSWTTDGAFLVTPAVLWHNHHPVSSSSSTTTTSTSLPTAGGGSGSSNGAPSYATCLYARHHFDQPYKVFSGLEKPSLVVRPNPVLFQLPENALVEVATKENAVASSLSPKNTASSSSSSSSSPASLPYKSIFCVLTNDSVLIYDTHHDVPLSVVRGLHYSNLADATWSQDGHSLVVCSTDGYISILRFAPGELGKVYTPPQPMPATALENEITTTTTTTVAALGVLKNGGNVSTASNTTAVPPTMMVRPKKSIALAATSNNNNSIKPLPPCEPGSEAVLEEPPMKRSKTCHGNGGGALSVTAQQLSSSGACNNKRPASALEEDNDDDDHDETVKAVDKLSLDNDNTNNNKKNIAADDDNQAASSRPIVMAKKKKRVQPVLLSSA